MERQLGRRCFCFPLLPVTAVCQALNRTVEYVKDEHKGCPQRPCHIQGWEKKNTEYSWCLYFSSPSVRGRVREQFFFLLRAEQNCRDKQTLPCKVKTQHLRCVLTYWFSLAAIGRRSKEDGAVCAGPRKLGEIQAALCTPREWGLAYIECLCCRIESVEHLCLNSLTVKLGLTKNPSYTNRKWSRALFFIYLIFFLFFWHQIFCMWAFFSFLQNMLLCATGSVSLFHMNMFKWTWIWKRSRRRGEYGQ